MSDEPKEAAPAKAPIHLVIGIPTGDTMEAGFGYDYGKMMMYLGMNVVAVGAVEMRTFMVQDTLVHKARNDIVETMLAKTDATHLLFLDSDMRFPWHAPLMLIQHNKPVIGVNYSTRSGVPRPVALVDIDQTEPHRRFLYPQPEPSPPVEVEAVGMGVCLIQREVFEKVAYPWFDIVYDPVNRRWLGEDVTFCRKVRAAGYGVWVDPILSDTIGHVGRFEYTLGHTKAVEGPKVVAPPPPKIIRPD